MVMYCSLIMYKYYLCIGGFLIKTIIKGNIFTMKYSTIYHISSKPVFVSIFFNVVFVYNDKALNRKREVIPPIPDFIIPIDFSQRNKHIINFTTDDMTSKFE